MMKSMGIQESLETLKQCQEIDRQIHRNQQELNSIPEIVQELTHQFEAEKSAMNQIETRLKEAQLRQKQKEGELSEKEGLTRKYDSQLTQVKTNKEYSALQQEIASLKADGSLLEDAILTILEEIEHIQGEVREERERLAQVQKASETRKKELESQVDSLKGSLAELNKKRVEIISQAPPEIRELYDRIIEKKGGLALVPVEGDACGACRMEIRPQLLNELKLKEALVICENCSRILCID